MSDTLQLDKAIQQTLQSAKKQCQQQGLRFTAKRSNVLKLMLFEDKPLSAYDIMDVYKASYNENISAVSIYRMLEFLIDAQFVHKLLTSSQYIACSHIRCQHKHETPKLLICDRCHQVEEVSLGKSLASELELKIAATGFTLRHQQLELHGICTRCNT